MSFLEFFLPIRHSTSSVPPPSKSAPLSIHPEPRFFVEGETNPLTRIRNVIRVSDGGVIGITGDRGAGKSVLLRMIAAGFGKREADPRQSNLTISMSSPISGSKEMEFFLMLFRELVQKVIDELRQQMRNYGDDIRMIGAQSLRQEQRRVLVLALSVTALTSFAALWAYDQLLLSVKRGEVRQYIDSLNQQIQPVQTVNSPEYGTLNAKLSNAQLHLSNLSRYSPLAGSEYATTYSARRTIRALLQLTVVSIGLLAALLLYNFLQPVVIGLLTLARASAEERGLLTYAQQIRKRLDYELTRTTDRSLEVTPFGWLKGTAKLSDQQKARALSLPELTSTYITFIANVRRVFSGKIIVCIDELDKIPNVEDIANILREIKGALYVEGTFYLLSISNDAMRSFEGRMGDSRDIFESTFDDVFPVKALELNDCLNILKRRMQAGPEGLSLKLYDDEALTMIAVFSAGNARDLIRCFRECVLSGKPGDLPDARGIWRSLFTRRLDAIRDRALVAGGSPELRNIALPILVGTEAEIPGNASTLTEVRRKLRTLFGGSDVPEIERTVALRFVRFASEVEILLLTREVFAELPHEDRQRAAAYLIAAYQRLPLSLTDCEALLDRYQHFLTDSGAEAPATMSTAYAIDTPVSVR